MKDRFFEREEFWKKLKGKKVIWVGYVENVDSLSLEDSTPMLIFKVSKDISNKRAFVRFDKNWRTKLFSLRKDDKIKVTGILEDPEFKPPWLEGISLELLN